MRRGSIGYAPLRCNHTDCAVQASESLTHCFPHHRSEREKKEKGGEKEKEGEGKK